jgi:hypothetical protein
MRSSHVAILALERGLDPPHCMQCLFNHALCITRAENTIHPYLDLTYYFRYTLCISLFPDSQFLQDTAGDQHASFPFRHRRARQFGPDPGRFRTAWVRLPSSLRVCPGLSLCPSLSAWGTLPTKQTPPSCPNLRRIVSRSGNTARAQLLAFYLILAADLVLLTLDSAPNSFTTAHEQLLLPPRPRLLHTRAPV